MSEAIGLITLFVLRVIAAMLIVGILAETIVR
jgi:hypothetical protein